MGAAQRIELEFVPAAQGLRSSQHEPLVQRRDAPDGAGQKPDLDRVAPPAETVMRTSGLTCEHRIRPEDMGPRPQAIARPQFLLLRVVRRTPTLVVAQSTYHRVGGFGFRGWPLRPEARKASAEVDC